MKFQVTFACGAELRPSNNRQPDMADVKRRIAEIIVEHLPDAHCTAVKGALLEVVFDSEPVVNVAD